MATSKLLKRHGIVANTTNGEITIRFNGQYTALISTQPWRSDYESLIFVGGYSTADANNKWTILKGGNGISIEHPSGIYGIKITSELGYDFKVSILPLIGDVEAVV